MPRLGFLGKQDAKKEKTKDSDGNNENIPRVVHNDNRMICFNESGGIRCIPKPEEKRNYYTGYEGWQNAVDNSGHFDYKTKKRRK